MDIFHCAHSKGLEFNGFCLDVTVDVVTTVPGKHHSAGCQPANTLTAAAVDGSGNVPNN